MKNHICNLPYETARNKPRDDLGCERNRERRCVWHEIKPNAWNKHRNASSPLNWAVLEACGSKPSRGVNATNACARGSDSANNKRTEASTRISRSMRQRDVFRYERPCVG